MPTVSMKISRAALRGLAFLADDRRQDTLVRESTDLDGDVDAAKAWVGRLVDNWPAHGPTDEDEEETVIINQVSLRALGIESEPTKAPCDSCEDEDYNGRTFCGFCGRRLNP